MSGLEELLKNAIDYAGLFPPAGLGMEETVRNYASYRKGKDRWALGRLVVPVSRLPEFEARGAALLEPGDPWALSVLGGTELALDLEAIRSFGKRRPEARIASLDLKAAAGAEIERAAATIQGSIETFYEIPLADSSLELLPAIQKARGRAKVRTGGTEKGSVPSSEGVARFLEEAASRRVAFKMTAGLHHPVRGVHPLTGEPAGPSERMHGFLNVLFAAALARSGLAAPGLRDLLEEEDPASFKADRSTIYWRNRSVGRPEIAQIRSDSFLSFGSCSFDDPIRELKEVGLL